MSTPEQVLDNNLTVNSPSGWGYRLQTEARRAAGWTTTALGFTIPMWVVADGVLVVLLVVCWLASGEWRERIRRVMRNPVALSALLLFGWLLLGTLWGGGDPEERLHALKKYADLLLIPLLISMALDVQVRNRALLALAASLGATLALSLVLSLGLLPIGGVIGCDLSNPCVFKKHTTHNVLMAFGVLLFGVLAWKSRGRWIGWGWGLASALAAGNVLLMVQGRTGYVVLAALALLAFHMYAGWRGILAAIVALSVVFSIAYKVSFAFHERVNLAAASVTQWNPKVAVVEDSIGWRLEYFYHTAEIIQDHPLIGVGTGGFVQAYRARTEQAGLDVPPHPHNQYLYIMVQVGVVGLGLVLWLFMQQWRLASLAGDEAYRLLARGVMVTIAVGCFFNPFLVDHTEKLFYCVFSGLLYSGTDSQRDTRT
ncbi:MAG: O-antigen ligase family protein [Nitrospiraceae bacterium]|nr:O-antigen ligase family protein [Nitrospiraceae bacterium]